MLLLFYVTVYSREKNKNAPKKYKSSKYQKKCMLVFILMQT